MGEQRLVVGYGSALSFWRAVRAVAGSRQVDDPDGGVFGRGARGATDLARRALALLELDPPLETVATTAERRLHTTLTRSRTCGAPLTDEHLFYVERGIAVCRMPAVLLQLALECDEIDLARIAYEMAGTYGLADREGSGFVGDVLPLVEVPELVGYASAARALGVRGARRTSEALELVVPGSNSPRETDIAIAMMLPRARGGFGVPGFLMNERIEITGRAREILGADSMRPDFYWPAQRLVVEYESDEYHATPAAIARDERRRRAFEAAGYTQKRLMNDVLRSNDAINGFMDEIAEIVDPHRRPPSERMRSRCRDLRERLFGPEQQETALRALQG